ncbi:hypothetical protein [Paenibacillus sp. MMS20-IR301]|uniref:hypothetical protein n=1 Tax=Paenibacillus sp. MMS20-IR301 TaxID=2895946 RepID=UPI0028EA4468|nr:hypothetical protein [Paenibacillus sp. MMS20-IR301]WNS45852.1 hypothetical protein LOS79_11455 [Paenibacillus sp. MMS20-IR301]
MTMSKVQGQPVKSDLSDAPLPFLLWAGTREHWPQLSDYLLSRSGLPGPRANLGLAGDFARCFANPEVSAEALSLLSSWCELPPNPQDANDPEEYLPLCALLAYGAYYGYGEQEHRSMVEEKLQAAMNDSRWRVREAAAMSLQLIGEFDFSLLQNLLEGWRRDATALEQRAFVAALAHPPLLKDEVHAGYCLELSEEILSGLLSGSHAQADPEHLRVLSKGLEYALSLFVAGKPEAGFALLRRISCSGDKTMIRIVKSNLSKKRLSGKYPDETAEILAGLTIA